MLRRGSGSEVEHVHPLRVATRRLVYRYFAEMLPSCDAERMEKRLRQLRHAAGAGVIWMYRAASSGCAERAARIGTEASHEETSERRKRFG